MLGLNVGGGSDYKHPGWDNLDAVGGFTLSPTVCFPHEDAHFDIVYSSHCLEHLDDATVSRVFVESRRVLKQDGSLLLKLPDFDLALQAWRKADLEFFADPIWAFESVTPTWSRKRVEDNYTHRASMIFCGYWNDVYGDHFSGRVNLGHPHAYHGPMPFDTPDTSRIFVFAGSPHKISAALRQHVLLYEAAPRFNHQNAWGANELDLLLDNHGFSLLDRNVDSICVAMSAVPGIREMQGISCYRLATKKGAIDLVLFGAIL